MAEDGPVTPEKQLLKLIEEAKGGDLPGTAGPKKSGRLFAPRQWIGSGLGRLAFWKRSAKKRGAVRRKFKWSMGALNRLLGLAVAAAFAYLVWDVGSSAVALRRPPHFVLQSEKAAAGARQETASLKDPGFYLQQISARDIFQDSSKVVKKKQQVEGKKAAVVIEEGNLSPSVLWNEIAKLMENPERVARMTEAAKSFARLDAAEIISREILKLGVH